MVVCAACVATGEIGASGASRDGSGVPGPLRVARPSPVDATPYKPKVISKQDPFGDAQKDTAGNPAADISDVTILNLKSGLIYVVVTIDQGKLYDGDELDVFIDSDRKTSTGCNGDEYVLAAVGFTDPKPDKFEFGRCAAGRFVFNISQAGFAGAFDAAKRQVAFRFSSSTLRGATRFNYTVGTFWSPNPTNTYKDFAPDQGHYSFALERAKVSCLTVFGSLVRDPGWAGVTSGGVLVLSSLRMRGVPPGAAVTFRNRGVVETVRANSSGIATSRRMLSRRLGKGSSIRVQIKKDACSTSIILKVNNAGRLVRSG